jgi:hypothetical protein
VSLSPQSKAGFSEQVGSYEPAFSIITLSCAIKY